MSLKILKSDLGNHMSTYMSKMEVSLLELSMRAKFSKVVHGVLILFTVGLYTKKFSAYLLQIICSVLF